MTFIPTVSKGIDIDCMKIHVHLLRDRENLNGKCVRWICEESSNYLSVHFGEESNQRMDINNVKCQLLDKNGRNQAESE